MRRDELGRFVPQTERRRQRILVVLGMLGVGSTTDIWNLVGGDRNLIRSCLYELMESGQVQRAEGWRWALCGRQGPRSGAEETGHRPHALAPPEIPRARALPAVDP